MSISPFDRHGIRVACNSLLHGHFWGIEPVISWRRPLGPYRKHYATEIAASTIKTLDLGLVEPNRRRMMLYPSHDLPVAIDHGRVARASVDSEGCGESGCWCRLLETIGAGAPAHARSAP